MHRIEALLFDVDGTLADTERDAHRPAFNATFAAAGLDWHWSVELYGELLAITGGKERIRYYIDRYRPDFKPPGDLDTFIAGLHRAKTAHYTRMLEQGGVPLRPGVRRLLREARHQGVRLAIATTTSPENVTALLEHCLEPGSTQWFEVIAAGDSVPAKKPAPDVYYHALDALRLAPDRCVAFEDSANGLKSSLGAGLGTIVTINDYTRDQDFPGAQLVLDHLGEPEQPFTVLAGDARGARYLDLGLLEQLARAAA